MSLIAAEIEWVPTAPEQSLYLRPFMFATEAFLGVRPAKRVTYCCIASPAGSYFASGVQPVSIWISTLLFTLGAGRHRRGEMRRQLRGEPDRRSRRRSTRDATK